MNAVFWKQVLTRDLASSACEDLSSNASRGSCFARPVFRPPQPRSDRASAERAGRATRVPDNGRDPQVSNFIASIGLRLLRWFSPLHINSEWHPDFRPNSTSKLAPREWRALSSVYSPGARNLDTEIHGAHSLCSTLGCSLWPAALHGTIGTRVE